MSLILLFIVTNISGQLFNSTYAKNVYLMQTTQQRTAGKYYCGVYTKQTRQPISFGTMFTKSRGIESSLH